MERYWTPEEFRELGDVARDLGFRNVASAPLVRSSYHADRQAADEKRHLTARDAGRIAGLAGVKQYTLFHHSPRYTDRLEEIESEAAEAFRTASRKRPERPRE